jgi:predicted transcriptional regulator
MGEARVVTALVAASLAAAAWARPAAPASKPEEPEKLPYTIVKRMVGKPLPAFAVTSGDRKRIASADLAGRVALITYETRDVVEKNRAAKDALMGVLKEKYKTGESELVAIIDASSANFFTRGVWRRKLVENAKKEKIVIYGDWDGKTAEALGVAREESNLIIVDASGVIRYFAHGAFDAKEIEKQKALLASLRPAPKKPAEATLPPKKPAANEPDE